ncbi:hypothetical protein Tco_1095157 [Tanacetum coccineum]
MRIDELYKFSDGTLNDVRTALDDILKRIRMKYLPQTYWKKVDKDRAGSMIQTIDKMLKNRRIIRSLEKFVGGRPFYTSAGNPVKEILLKLNLPDHRILKDGGEVEDQMKKSLKTEHPPRREAPRLYRKESVQWKKAINEEMVPLEKNQTCSLEPSYVGSINDTSTQHKSEGFQLASQKENLECKLEKSLYILKQALRQWYTKSSIHFAKNLKVYSWAKLVRILISEGSLSLLKILGTKSLAKMFTRLVMNEKLKFCTASTGLRVNW